MTDGLERYRALMARFEALKLAFNKYAESKNLVLCESSSRVEHEQGWIHISYKTEFAQFTYAHQLADDRADLLPYHYHQALTTATVHPLNFMSSTGHWTPYMEVQWQEALESIKGVKPPLAEKAAEPEASS